MPFRDRLHGNGVSQLLVSVAPNQTIGGDSSMPEETDMGTDDRVDRAKRGGIVVSAVDERRPDVTHWQAILNITEALSFNQTRPLHGHGVLRRDVI